jgi:hypothetical protein
MYRPPQFVTKSTFRYYVNAVAKPVFQKVLQLDKIEEICIFREIHEKIDVAVRALLLPCVRAKEPDSPDFERAPEFGVQAGKDLQNLIP